MSQDTVGWEAGQGLSGGAQSVLLNSLPTPQAWLLGTAL